MPVNPVFKCEEGVGVKGCYLADLLRSGMIRISIIVSDESTVQP